jgi:CRISPR-associated endonuclease/helicase Cas3
MAVTPPASTPQREFIKTPHVGDVWRWRATSDQAFVDEELSLWIRDSLEPDQIRAGLVIRDRMPDDDALTLPLLTVTPPCDAEIFPVALGTLQTVVAQILDADGLRARAFLERDGDVSPITTEADGHVHLRAGDLVVVDNGHSLTRGGVVVADASQSEHLADPVWGPDGTRVILDGDPDDHWLTDLAGIGRDEAQELFDPSGAQVVICGPCPDDGTSLPWLVVSPADVMASDESLAQTWTRSGHTVTLEAHQSAVADLAEQLARSLGLVPDVCTDLGLAGLHHDDGKADDRFQRYRLHAPEGSVPLAKSIVSAQRARWDRWASGLPAGWRHELRSVAVAWPYLTAAADPELVARLIGTSHGHGRVLPQTDATSLVNSGDDEDLRRLIGDLFADGEWCSLIDRTDHRIGPWACCYLEAVLRAADCRVSREGS